MRGECNTARVYRDRWPVREDEIRVKGWRAGPFVEGLRTGSRHYSHVENIRR